ncbi:MAG: DUF5134 domain-containing protein [Jatrophihabitantaceae bacterium]
MLLNRALAGLMLAIAGYHTVRLVAAGRGRALVGWQVELTHLVMAAVMAYMTLRPIPVKPDIALLIGFTVSAAWFAGRSVRSLSAGARWRVVHRMQHSVMCAAMLFMLSGALTGQVERMQMMGSPDASQLSLLSLALVGSLLVLSVWNVDQLGQLQASRFAPGRLLRAAGTGGLSVSTVTVSCRLAMCLAMSYLIVVGGR